MNVTQVVLLSQSILPLRDLEMSFLHELTDEICIYKIGYRSRELKLRLFYPNFLKLNWNDIVKHRVSIRICRFECFKHIHFGSIPLPCSKLLKASRVNSYRIVARINSSFPQLVFKKTEIFSYREVEPK